METAVGQNFWRTVTGTPQSHVWSGRTALVTIRVRLSEEESDGACAWYVIFEEVVESGLCWLTSLIRYNVGMFETSSGRTLVGVRLGFFVYLDVASRREQPPITVVLPCGYVRLGKVSAESTQPERILLLRTGTPAPIPLSSTSLFSRISDDEKWKNPRQNRVEEPSRR
ncbi:unnamed protein product [Boreogadus saida]